MSNRELDAEVAEKVMGWTRSEKRLSASDGNTYIRKNGMIEQWEDDFGPTASQFSPSSDIAAAFLVVGRMREKGWIFMLNEGYYSEEYTARFKFRQEGDEPEEFHTSSSIPEAICRAALAAISS